MASAELSRRVEKVVGYPPLCDMGDAFGHVGRERVSSKRGDVRPRHDARDTAGPWRTDGQSRTRRV
jgi:hypothetical protein